MLKTLQLQNFRNYSKRSFEFSPQVTLIVGPNAIGKTNILEAIYQLSTGKSFRAEEERELIKEGQEVARISSDELEIIWDRRERFAKHYRNNGVPKRQMDFVGNLRAVLFSPADIEIVADSPSTRRKYLDLVLTQVFKDYRVAAHIYERALRQRNRLLRGARDQGLGARDISDRLKYWDGLLVTNGKIIHDRRKEYLRFLGELGDLRGHIFPINLHYDHSIISEERLKRYALEEVGAATTLVGPHRDDFIIKGLGARGQGLERDIRIFGSRGEQRMATFELKLGELAFVKEKIRENPILLLDDVFSELDHKNRHLLLEVIPKQQTIMTTTDLHLVEKEFLKGVELIELR